jgi:hypothetical protein
MRTREVTATLDELNAASSSLPIKGENGGHDLSIVASVDFDGTCTYQCSFDSGVTWLDVQDFTTSVQTSAIVYSDQLVRFQLTEWTAGDVEVRIRKG